MINIFRYSLFVWFAGLLFPYLYYKSVLIIFTHIKNYKLIIKKRELLLIFFLLFVIASFFINIGKLGSVDRFLSSSNFIYEYVFYLFAISYFKKQDLQKEIFFIKKYSYYNMIIVFVIILILLSLYFSGMKNINFSLSPLKLPDIINSYYRLALITNQYFLISLPRISLYTSINTLFPLLFGLLSVYGILYTKYKKTYSLSMIFIMFFALSRTTMSSVFVILLFIFIIKMIKNKRYIILALTSIIIFIGMFSMYDVVHFLLELRTGSNHTRTNYYITAFEFLNKENSFLSFFIGLGHFPKVDYLDSSIGSHSNLLNITVFAGLLSMFIFYVHLLSNFFRIIIIFFKNQNRKIENLILVSIASIMYIIFWSVTDAIFMNILLMYLIAYNISVINRLKYYMKGNI